MTDTVKKIIPCLDVDEGRVVKGRKFVDMQDIGDPVELARRYCDEGADELTLLDIGASHKSRSILLDVIRRVASEISIPLCVGGGIRTADDMRQVLDAGAAKVSVCSSALEKPVLLTEMASINGSQCVVLAIDAKRVTQYGSDRPRWNAFSKGGRIDIGLDAVVWAIKGVELGAGEILVNSIDADGTGEGYDIELCAAMKSAVSVPVIASGGAGNLEQIAAVLAPSDLVVKGKKFPGVDAALVASMLHFGKTTIPEIKSHLVSKGITVR
jgi:cyclase